MSKFHNKLALTLLASAMTLGCASPSTDVAADGEATITINPQTQLFLGDVSQLDREKFVNTHSLFPEADPEFEAFKRDYNLNPDYIGSRRFSYPVGKIKNGKIPTKIEQKYSGVRDVSKYIATGTEGAIFHSKSADYSKENISPYIKDMATYIAGSFKSEWDLVPMYLEPTNEPMIHLRKYINGATGKDVQARVESLATYICEYHREIGRAVHATPELKNMQVMGFGSAFPEFETNNFELWNQRFKQFIDVAGEDIDIISFHLYDGSGDNNKSGRRSGSNSEAIMDILQTYSNIRLGKVLPLAITEYGRLVPNQPEWEAATGAVGNDLGGKKVTTKLSNYNSVTNSQAVRSQLHFVMSFMNRENEIVLTAPFTIGKAPQSALYSKSSLWVEQENGSYEYSNRILFFEMLKDLKGNRCDITSNNIDIQTLAFADSDKIYVMLNNINPEPQTVTLDMLNTKGLKSVDIKSLKIFVDKDPEFVQTSGDAPKTIEMDYGQTVVLTYNYDKEITFKDKITRKKFFSKDYLQPIKGGDEVSFAIENVESGTGRATLRLGVNREHELNEIPAELRINGSLVEIKGDVVKGYDQSSRKQFFGTLEIPIDIKLITSGTNIVDVKYNEDGGFVTTAILQLDLKD